MSRAVLAFLLTMAGCSADPAEVDQCLRREIFQQCLVNAPRGPERTVTNDWDEVVARCESAAYYQSIRRTSQITKECRP